MAAKMMLRCAGLTLLAGLLLAGSCLAGPDGDGFGRPCRDCPRGEYSPLHYWAPALSYVRAYVHPSYLDQYPPGPSPSVAPSYDVRKYPCPATPPMPSSPYADPAAYYGRSAPR
jgi:hypothetical protein